MGISERFREQREHLRLTQGDVAELVCVSLNTVNNWERGSSSPSAAALARFSYAGADVLYIVTGERTPRSVLTAEENTLLDQYHQANPQIKAAAQAVLASGAISASSLAVNAKKIGAVNTGPVGVIKQTF